MLLKVGSNAVRGGALILNSYVVVAYYYQFSILVSSHEKENHISVASQSYGNLAKHSKKLYWIVCPLQFL